MMINNRDPESLDALDHVDYHISSMADATVIINNYTYEEMSNLYERPKIKTKYSRHLTEYIAKLRDDDRKIVEDYYYNKKTQTLIDTMSQGNVSHRLKRIRRDIKFYVDFQKYLDLSLIKPLLKESELRLVEYKLQMLPILQIAKLIGCGQPTTHNHWHAIIDKVRLASHLDHRLRPYLAMLETINTMTHMQSWTPDRRQALREARIARHRQASVSPLPQMACNAV